MLCQHHFACAWSGRLILYRLIPQRDEEVYAVVCAESGEPVKWICMRAQARSWLVHTAGLPESTATSILRESDLWASHYTTPAYRCPSPAVCG